jgi:hypothetical protein
VQTEVRDLGSNLVKDFSDTVKEKKEDDTDIDKYDLG